jgi:hypothetical protein
VFLDTPHTSPTKKKSPFGSRLLLSNGILRRHFRWLAQYSVAEVVTEAAFAPRDYASRVSATPRPAHLPRPRGRRSDGLVGEGLHRGARRDQDGDAAEHGVATRRGCARLAGSRSLLKDLGDPRRPCQNFAQMAVVRCAPRRTATIEPSPHEL